MLKSANHEQPTILGALRPAAWILVAAAVLKTHADPDLWGHLRFGLDIARDRALPSVDPYSFTQDVPWINHEWLSELLMALAYSACGEAGLVLLKGTVAGVALWLIARTLRHAPDRIRWPALCLAAWGALPLTSTVRPQLWTLLLLAILCRLLTGSSRGLMLVPLLFVPWANLHGGWLVGLGVLTVWCFVRALEPLHKRPSRTLLAAVPVAGLLATLCTPYGWDLWEFLGATVRLSRADIGEWQPIWRDSLTTQIQWAGGVAFSLVLWRMGVRRGAPLAVAALLAFASLRVNRLVPLFLVASTMLLGSGLTPRPQRGLAPRARTLIDAVAVAVAIGCGVWLNAIPRCISSIGSWTPDTAAAEALRHSGARGRMITWFEWGEYALWHLSPELLVSIDGRRETVYSERTLQEQRQIAMGTPGGLAALERLSPEYVWLPYSYSTRTAEWLVDHGYRLDISTPRSFVAVRADLPRIEPAVVEASACFPGP